MVTVSSPTDNGGSFALPPGTTAGTSAEVPGRTGMTTIDDLLGAGDGTVVQLNERHPRRRVHLQRLLDVRARLAVLAAEQRSHDLPEQQEITRLLWAVEETIHGGWPRTYYEQFPQWCADEETLLHEPTRSATSCSVCRAGSPPGSMNHQPPGAA